jgi:ribonuclease Z
MARDPLNPLHNPGVAQALSIRGHELVAFSISGVSTYVLAPSLDACFDMGHCPVEGARLRNVLLTHCHQDHALGVIRHRAIRQMWGDSPSRVFVPEESRAALLAVLRAVDAMEGRGREDTLERDVTGVRAGETFELSKRCRVEAFDVVHKAPSRGYSAIERRRALKAPFVGRPGVELAEARRRGEELYDYTDQRTITYIGDSTIETLERVDPSVLDCDVLFLEATHVGATDPAVSEKYGHTHLNELAALFRRAPERFGRSQIVLKHWSTRYSRSEITEALRALPPAFGARITALL